jgi:hypothetical protein
MRSIGLIGSLAVLAISAPLAAQSNNFRTDNGLSSVSPIQNQRGRTASRIPPGQLPPAGMCRIWINGVPPGQQPAPTDCQTAVANKPANAQVIWGSQTAFPGNGRMKSKKERDDQTNQAVRQNGRGRGDDAENDNDGDDGNGSNVGSGSNVNRVNVSRRSATNGAGIRTSRGQSLESKNGKGHGNR